jgi:hypothetical protein
MPYIGMFTEEAIQKQINRAAEKLGNGKSGLVAHIDNQGEVSVSVVQRFGEIISVEAIGIMDTSEGFKFDKEHLKVQAELIARW